MSDNTGRGNRHGEDPGYVDAPVLCLTPCYRVTAHPIFTIGVDGEAVRPWLDEAHRYTSTKSQKWF
jgi:hypothetical protein